MVNKEFPIYGTDRSVTLQANTRFSERLAFWNGVLVMGTVGHELRGERGGDPWRGTDIYSCGLEAVRGIIRRRCRCTVRLILFASVAS